MLQGGLLGVLQSRNWHRAAARWIAAFGVLLATSASAQDVLITWLEGDAVVTDGARRLAAVAGLRVAPGALIDTSASTTLLRLEWSDQVVIDLGPSTRLMVSPTAFRTRAGRPPAVYLLKGWAKLTGGALLMPQLELLPVAGAAVVFVGAGEPQVFAESGTLDVVDRLGGTQQGIAPGMLHSGGAAAARPPAAWLQGVPRAFRDPIPRRIAQFQGRNVDASSLPAPTYGDLADWLQAEPELRRDFPARFAALARDPAFRQAVRLRLSAHPEWAAVLRNSK
jgi:hypothetical protein